MCRLSSSLFGDQVFQRCSRDGYERWIRLPRAFHQEETGFGVIMGEDAEARLV